MRQLIGCVGVGMLVVAGGADWPGFRGPDGNGVAVGTPPTRWTDREGVKWRAALPGPGSSSPVVAGDRVFVTCYSGYGVTASAPGSPEMLTRHLVCFDRATGKPRWTADVASAVPEDPYRGYLTEHGYASSTPTVGGGAVYVFFGKSGVLAFDLDGKELWRTSLGTGSDVRGWGSAASPVLWNDLVIVNAASEGRAVVTLDRKTGKQVWKAGGDKLSLSFSTPALVRAGDRTDLVVAMPGEVWGLNPQTGKLRWLAEISPSGNVCPAVVPGDGVAYVTGGFQTRATVAVKVGGSGDVTKTHVLWSVRTGSYVPTPALSGSRLFYVSETGSAVCLRADTGAVVYDERLSVKGSVGGRPFYASAVVADGRLYAPSRRAGVLVLKAGDAFEQIRQNPPLDDSDCNASPAVAGRQLFLRSNKYLYCLESAD